MRLMTIMLVCLLLQACAIYNRSNVTNIYSPASTEGRSSVSVTGTRKVDGDKSTDAAVSANNTARSDTKAGGPDEPAGKNKTDKSAKAQEE